MCWVYRHRKGYEVGYYKPSGEWELIRRYEDEAAAIAMVSSLNGGI